MSEQWVVWSEEHGAWWRPGKWGYTTSLREAGRYPEAEANAIADQANRYSKTLKEVALPDPLWNGGTSEQASRLDWETPREQPRG